MSLYKEVEKRYNSIKRPKLSVTDGNTGMEDRLVYYGDTLVFHRNCRQGDPDDTHKIIENLPRDVGYLLGVIQTIVETVKIHQGKAHGITRSLITTLFDEELLSRGDIDYIPEKEFYVYRALVYDTPEEEEYFLSEKEAEEFCNSKESYIIDPILVHFSCNALNSKKRDKALAKLTQEEKKLLGLMYETN